jgi:hypothetical protein
MTDDILDALFHACAFAAILGKARAHQGWPYTEATRQCAYQLYEQALAEKTCRPKALAPRPAQDYALDP